MSIAEKLKELDDQRQALQVKNSKVLRIFLSIPAVFIIGLIFQFALPPVIFFTVLTAIFAGISHYSQIGIPFQNLASKLKSELIGEYMRSYHPDTSYYYQTEKKDVRRIIKSSKLIRANVFKEEDVLTGTYKNTNFYLSEIDLKRKSNKSSVRVFKGMMFRLSIPGKNFPNSLIQSKVGLLKKHLWNFEANDEYGFHYATSDQASFNSELGSLFPFIQHLIKQQGDLRIETDGEEILILLESNDDFLDTPRPKLNLSFMHQDHYTNLVKQLNTFLYIVDAFSSESSPSEVEEQLELRMLDIIKKEQR
jgi:hypothetical protein